MAQSDAFRQLRLTALFDSQVKPESRTYRLRLTGGGVIVQFWVLAFVGVLLSAQEPAHRGVNLYSKEKEAALGASLASEVRRHTSPIADSAVHGYIEALGRQIAAQVPGGDVDWEFAVIRDALGGSTHEALSIPGGHIFVSVSLILAADSEAELAGMLAHSITHIAERHGTRMALVVNPASIPLVYMGGWVGTVENDDRASVPAGYLKTQRSNELDADRGAVNALAAAGYNPAALLNYIRRTQRAFSAVSGMYSALPPREERISALETVITNLPSGTSGLGGEFRAIQDRVRELAVPLRQMSPAPLKPPSLRRKDEQ